MKLTFCAYTAHSCLLWFLSDDEFILSIGDCHLGNALLKPHERQIDGGGRDRIRKGGREGAVSSRSNEERERNKEKGDRAETSEKEREEL